MEATKAKTGEAGSNQLLKRSRSKGARSSLMLKLMRDLVLLAELAPLAKTLLQLVIRNIDAR
jgi:hypothetical protein